MNHIRAQSESKVGQAGGIAAASTAPREVPEKLAHLSSTIEQLECAIGPLLNGINPILLPAHPQEDGKLVGGQLPAATELGAELEEMRKRVYRVCEDIRNASSRLAI